MVIVSIMDYVRYGFFLRYRDMGIFDFIGCFFGGDRGVFKWGFGKVSFEE